MHISNTRNRSVLEKRRKRAGDLFDQRVAQSVIAKRLDVSRAAVCQWHAAWKKKGDQGLISKGHPGFPSKLTAEKKKELKRLILKGPRAEGYATDFWTVDRIRDLARKKLRIALGYTRIWNTIVQLGFSCQKPEARAKTRNERAIADWTLKQFLRFKKMGAETRLSHGVS
jgi:transposase